jgi:thiol-disulfide isomerase/thioredoxin
MCALAVVHVVGQDDTAGPTNEKARKSYREAMDYLNQHRWAAAFESFKKADKQDGGRCLACQRQIIKSAIGLGEWKAAEVAAGEMVEEAQGPKILAIAHYEFGAVLMNEGADKHKDEFFARAHDEFTKALASAPNFPIAVYNDGLALAHMNQDDAAKTQFECYVKMVPPDDSFRPRALFFVNHPALAREKMAPLFSVTTVDGQHISLEDLKGKVVLIDFWATWCGPCHEALPHMLKIAKKFQGEPLVMLSVSLDTDEKKWKDFIAKNEMTWLNCRDGSFDAAMAKLFAVHEIPHTFTIDADGVLQDEHVGDAAIEGKLKKQLARAREMQEADKAGR